MKATYDRGLTYKYRLYPTREQGRELVRMLRMTRELYNAALEQRITAYKKHGVSVRYLDQQAQLTELRRSDESYGDLNCSMCQRAIRRLDKAFAKFFRQDGGKAGFPKFRGAYHWNSLEFTYGSGTKLRGESLYVQGVGEIPIRLHRPIPNDAIPKAVVVKKQGQRWFACIQIAYDYREDKPDTGGAIGVDMGLRYALALSDGTTIESPKWYRESEARRRKLQRAMARRSACPECQSRRTSAKGRNRKCLNCGNGWRWQPSKGWIRAKDALAEHEAYIQRCRRDWWHKVTTDLAKGYDLVVIEDLSMGFMLANKNLAKAASDVALGEFRKLLRYKCDKFGTELIEVDPSGTSQECSGCGVVVAKTLKDRVHKCRDCGLEIDRDHNAAINILNRGLDQVTESRVA